MSWEQLFWWVVTLLCIGWYCTITAYVAIRGASDIRVMLRHLRHGPDAVRGSEGVQPERDGTIKPN